jgi:hypothetical protein
MRYALATHPGMSDRIVEIPKDRYEATVRARSNLLECLYMEEKFDLVIQDYLDWERALLEGGLGYLAAPVLNSQHAATDRAVFNRRLMNLLSSAKTYTEQVPGRHVPKVLPEADAVERHVIPHPGRQVIPHPVSCVSSTLSRLPSQAFRPVPAVS